MPANEVICIFQECGLQRACSWDDCPSNIPYDLWQKLSTLYDSPSDIDLFTGGLAENVIAGANMGATFGCIIGRQFRALKFGDRFFFSHNPRATSGNGNKSGSNNATSNPNPFTENQGIYRPSQIKSRVTPTNEATTTISGLII